jgi:hypothetical protein
MPNQKKDDMDMNSQPQAKGMAASAGAGAHRPDAQNIDAPENVGGDEQLNTGRKYENTTGERLDAQGFDNQESQGQHLRQQNQRQQHEE